MLLPLALGNIQKMTRYGGTLRSQYTINTTINNMYRVKQNEETFAVTVHHSLKSSSSVRRMRRREK